MKNYPYPINVLVLHKGAKIIIKSSEFNKDKHQYLGVLVMPV